ncbi:Mpo1-like protein [Psychrobium sp. nBUS_13]|uniref:Mpo1-like protein n=1 Tax=Psychrobium sp. nBUS_13 TaxID=3395319 RepID=UPI003EB96E00
MEQRYQSFNEFYPFYLSQHQHPVCRQLHFVGSALILLVLAYTLYNQQFMWLLSLPIIGYGFAWVGHFIFEKNRPATFTYPLWSLMGDWKMFWQILTRQI